MTYRFILQEMIIGKQFLSVAKMSNKIYNFNKNTLTEIDHVDLVIEDAQALIIDQLVDSANFSASSTLPFTISLAEKHVPFLEEEEFMVVVREKVNLSAQGPNDVIIKNVDKDIGQGSYKDKKPYRPVELPTGFTEMKRSNNE
jgi:hypothetical protein